jgi:hypothetical protein
VAADRLIANWSRAPPDHPRNPAMAGPARDSSGPAPRSSNTPMSSTLPGTPGGVGGRS